jgi:hypothetical protein
MWNGMICNQNWSTISSERDRNAMAGKPEVTLTKSLNTEFKKFGVFGFMDVVEKRQAVLSKKV